MQTSLPPDLITRVKQLLLPHVVQTADRQALLTEAFYIRDRALFYNIELEGRPNTFVVQCTRTLLDFGCLPGGPHALTALLQALNSRCGAAEQREIQQLTQCLNNLCTDGSPTVDLAAQTAQAAVPGQPTQTSATPAAQRSPTVFISYSHEDSAVAQRLVKDLNSAGHACWIDTSSIKGGDEWQRAISEGINNSHTVLVLCSRAALDSHWVREEIIRATGKKKCIIPVLLEDVLSDDGLFGLRSFQAIRLEGDYEAGLRKLLDALPPPQAKTPEPQQPVRAPLPRRALELEYLDRLQFAELQYAKYYTPLAGVSQVAPHAPTGVPLRPVVMRPEFEYTPWMREREQMRVTRRFENAVEELLQIRRVVVLGEPGAGKTATLWQLASNLLDTALKNPQAPLPLLVRLGKWTAPGQALTDFIAGELGELGEHLHALLNEQHAALLLDGLNEVPVTQRQDKARQVQALVQAYPALMAVVTCREQDYTIDLGFDRLTIAPLEPEHVQDFVVRYLGQEAGEQLFWKLAGGEDVRHVWETWQRAGANLKLFFNASDVPRENPNVYSATSGQEEYLWRKHVRSAGSLMNLARNPYMLYMLTQVFVDRQGELPANRGLLFDGFVEMLLLREHIAERDPRTRTIRLTPDATALLESLQRLAYAMQRQHDAQAASNDGANALTALPLAQARKILNDHALYLAGSASLLGMGSEVRFTHQLLQEYFAAQYMKGEIAAGRLRATDIWQPGHWWERTNWEEAAVLLAGLYSDDCTPALDWVMDANPEVAARCMLESGAFVPDDAKPQFQARWLPQLTDVQRQPNPHARAAIGRALGLVMLGDGSLDDRKGVGVIHSSGHAIPDIDWVLIPDDGEFIYGDESENNGPRNLRLPAFSIARYPITYAQFQCFVDAPDGFANPKWWKGLAADAAHRRSPGEQAFRYANHPRECVSWYDAVAFCRWLSEQLGEAIRLPTEWEWEKAARGRQGLIYPWENTYLKGRANTFEAGEYYLGSTSAVGIYPQGASPYDVLDMSGNVWEWCLNQYEQPDNIQLRGERVRVVRGGSWGSFLDFARASYRSRHDPNYRGDNVGFRVVSGSAHVHLPLLLAGYAQRRA